MGAAAYLVSKASQPLLNRLALKKLQGEFAVVTGASSGIGYDLARELGQAGCDLLIVSDSAKIEEAAQSLRNELRVHEESRQVRIETVQADLSTFEGVEKLYDRIRSFGRPVDIIAINAGVGYGGDFVRDQDLQGILKLIQINVASSVHLAKRVLEEMVARNHGKVLITSSIAAFMAGSYEATYSASKAFLETFAQGIRNELKDTDVTITTLLPGATESEFFRRAQMEDTRIGAGKKDSPAQVARQGVSALARGQSHVIAGSFTNRIQAGLAKLLPQTVTAQIHRMMSKPGTAKQSRAA